MNFIKHRAKAFLRKWLNLNNLIVSKLEKTVLSTDKKTDYTLVSNNLDLQGKYKDETCFIIGCGPSIKNQDLSVLANQYVIGLSTVFYHKDYHKLSPLVSFYTGYAFHKFFHEEEHFHTQYNEIDKYAKGLLFFEEGDYNFIRKNNFFKEKNVRFYKVEGDINNILKKPPTIEKSIYAGQNISIMAIQLAISMGFKKIYLLGLDHSWIFQLKNKEYTKFSADKDASFKETKKTDFDVQGQDKLAFWIDVYHKLWSDYKCIKSFTDAKNISIIDLTENGCLDIFEKKRLDNIIE